MSILIAKILKTSIRTPLGPTDATVKVREFVDSKDTAVTLANFGEWFVIVIKQGDVIEMIKCSGITQNADGSADLTIASNGRDIDPTSPYAGYASGKDFQTGDVIVSNDPLTMTKFMTETAWTWEELQTFAQSPIVPTPTSSEETVAASVKYVNDIAINGAPDASETVKGIVEIATDVELATGEDVGSTGAKLVPSASNFKNSSAGSVDVNKVPVLDANGKLDNSFLNDLITREADQIQITTDPDSAEDAVRKSYVDTKVDTKALEQFFGDESDGEFNQATGTTTWNTAEKHVYQFSDFSLTGDAILTLGSNLNGKKIWVFVNGSLTITSSASKAINLDGLGGLGGTAGGNGSNGESLASNSNSGGGAGGTSSGTATTYGGGGGGGGGMHSVGVAGTAGSAGSGGGGGSAGATSVLIPNIYWEGKLLSDLLSCGAGGGAGGGGSATYAGGVGGAGGGCIIFIVKGDVNITSVMSAIGANGQAGTRDEPNHYYNGGGGGGGGGGSFGIFYSGSLIANTATFYVSGGSGSASYVQGGSGGSGLAIVKKIYKALLNISF